MAKASFEDFAFSLLCPGKIGQTRSEHRGDGGEDLPPLGNLPFIKSDSELGNTTMGHKKVG